MKDSVISSGNIRDFELAASVQPKLMNESDSGGGELNDLSTQPVIASNIGSLIVRNKK